MQTQYSELEQMSDERFANGAAEWYLAAGDILAHRYRKLVRCCAHPYFLAGGQRGSAAGGNVWPYKGHREFRADRDAAFRPCRSMYPQPPMLGDSSVTGG